MNTPSPPTSHRQGPVNSNRRFVPNNQVMHVNKIAPLSYAVEDVITSQGSLRRDMMRTDKTVQDVRQENIMLAEKVQHATNLYRQLLGRVSKTEEKMDLENKTMTQIISQAKQVELQIISQQESLVSRESQIEIQMSKLQEEVAMLKSERDQSRKQQHQMSQDVRQLQDKVTRQSGLLSNGLKELKAHLDQMDLEKTQMFNMQLNEIRERVENNEHSKNIFQTQMEGKVETLKMQIKQIDKQRQEDVYHMSTLTREKEALAKADVRRLQEKFRDVFEEFNKSISGKDGKLRLDLDGRVVDLEKRMTNEKKITKEKFQEMEEEAEERYKELQKAVEDELENLNGKLQQKHEDEGIQHLQKLLKTLDKQVNTNKKDIEKVVRAEISSRLTQGEKLTQQMNHVHNESNEGLSLFQQKLHENKRKLEHSIAETKNEMQRLFNSLKGELSCKYDEKRIAGLDRKMEDIEDALDEFAKQDERIVLNSERIKQIEMENILAQGDLHNAIDANTKRINQTVERYRETVEEMENEKNKPERPSTAFVEFKTETEDTLKKQEILPSQIKLVEKKLRFLGEAFDEYKREHSKQSDADDLNEKKIKEYDEQLQKMEETMEILREVLTSKIDDEHHKNKKDKLLVDLKKQLDDLKKQEKGDEDDEDDDDDDEEEDEEQGKGNEDDDEEEGDDEEEEDDDDEEEEGDDEEDEIQDDEDDEDDKDADDGDDEDDDDDDADADDDDQDKPETKPAQKARGMPDKNKGGKAKQGAEVRKI